MVCEPHNQRRQRRSRYFISHRPAHAPLLARLSNRRRLDEAAEGTCVRRQCLLLRALAKGGNDRKEGDWRPGLRKAEYDPCLSLTKSSPVPKSCLCPKQNEQNEQSLMRLIWICDSFVMNRITGEFCPRWYVTDACSASMFSNAQVLAQ